MKMMILAGALLIAALAACGGGSTGGALTPLATPTATAAPYTPQQFLRPEAVGSVPSLPYQQVTTPANGQISDNGATYGLAAAVPVYDIGANTVQFSFTANANGIPVATQVGSTTTFESPILLSNGTIQQMFVINGATGIPCYVDSYNFNDGSIAGQPVDTNGTAFIDYFICGGNPF